MGAAMGKWHGSVIQPSYRKHLGQALPEYVLSAGLLLIGAVAAFQALDLGTVMSDFIANSAWGTRSGGQIEVQSPGATIP
jgi:hypothetical protein